MGHPRFSSSRPDVRPMGQTVVVRCSGGSGVAEGGCIVSLKVIPGEQARCVPVR